MSELTPISREMSLLHSLTLEIKGKKDFIIANGVPLMTAMIHLTDGELSFLAMNVRCYIPYPFSVHLSAVKKRSEFA